MTFLNLEKFESMSSRSSKSSYEKCVSNPEDFISYVVSELKNNSFKFKKGIFQKNYIFNNSYCFSLSKNKKLSLEYFTYGGSLLSNYDEGLLDFAHLYVVENVPYHIVNRSY